MYKMYHYTCRENILSIQKEGIRLGQSPLLGASVVSMTVNSCPKRLGLHSGTVLIEGIDPEFMAAQKNYPSLVAKTVDGKRMVKTFDQTEARIALIIPKEFMKHILTYDDLFKRDAKSLIGQSLSSLTKKQQKLLWAAPVHSADYPFSTSHLTNQQIDREIIEIAEGKRSHRADDWRFSVLQVPPEYISKIEYCGSDGTYGLR